MASPVEQTVVALQAALQKFEEIKKLVKVFVIEDENIVNLLFALRYQPTGVSYEPVVLLGGSVYVVADFERGIYYKDSPIYDSNETALSAYYVDRFDFAKMFLKPEKNSIKIETLQDDKIVIIIEPLDNPDPKYEDEDAPRPSKLILQLVK